MDQICAICRGKESLRVWWLEPKHEKGNPINFILVCKKCHRDLIAIRRWRKHGH